MIFQSLFQGLEVLEFQKGLVQFGKEFVIFGGQKGEARSTVIAL